MEKPVPAIKYRVTLTEEEVEMLEALLRKGKTAARKQTRTRILLDPDFPLHPISKALFANPVGFTPLHA